MAITNKSASALARLKNQSKEQDISFQMCLQLFVQEEFLRRLSYSKYKENLILKGGMFIYTLTNYQSRPTMDIDFLAKQMSNDLDNVKSIVSEICSVKTENDYIVIEILDIEHITLDKEYPGIKIKLLGRINNIRVPFSIDIGINDAITPSSKVREIKPRLDGFVSPEVYTYSLESTISEKLDAIFQRMEGTSRMKDFYDIYYLSTMFDFDGEMLKKAIINTTNQRNHNLDTEAFDRIAGFENNDILLKLWSNFEPAKKSNLTLGKAIKRLIDFINPVYDSILLDKDFTKHWDKSTLCWK